MPHTITLHPFAAQFTCAEDETILDAGLRQGFNLRYGCRDGGCGSCKALITAGEVDQEDASSYALMDFEREQGYALLCSAYPLSDVEIELTDYEPDELYAAVPTAREFTAEVAEIAELTHDIRGLRLKLLGPDHLDFRAGQYVELQVPGTAVWRAYSMANPPSRRGEIELIVKLMPGGLFSEHLRSHARAGERLAVRGPFGSFYLRDPGQPALFVAGGSGMAPILSFLRDMAERGESRPVTFFYGARGRRDLFALDELRDLETRLPHFRFIPALSEPDPADHWAGESGLITEVVRRHLPDCAGMEAYLCGPPAMIDAAHRVLRAGGMAESRIFCDRFTSEADKHAVASS